MCNFTLNGPKYIQQQKYLFWTEVYLKKTHACIPGGEAENFYQLAS